jgi:hypothetical protein
MTLFNGALILLSALLSVSLIINIILSWYALNATRQIRNDQSQILGLIGELEELQDIIGIYVAHLHSVAEMEMFYGDETLRELMRHGDAVVEAFQDYRSLYPSILEQQEEIYDDIGEENQDTETATKAI